MPVTRNPRLCVYCASRLGADPAYKQAAINLAESFVELGIDLVFGGGQVGLMGVIANVVLDGGRKVIGVIPQNLMDREIAHSGVQDMRVVPDMPARKRVMFDESDGFVTLPGGVGTMEEMFEVLCWAYLGLHPKPVGLLNVNGYYDDLIAFLDNSVDQGLTKPRARELLVVDDEADRLVRTLIAMTANADGR